MARVKVFEYEELPPEMQELADTYKAKSGSWDHVRVLAHRPELYADYYRFLYPLHTAGVVEVPLKELVRHKIEFSDAELVELGMAIGQYIGFGRFLMVFDVEHPVSSLK